jgi:hypothetical protein
MINILSSCTSDDQSAPTGVLQPHNRSSIARKLGEGCFGAEARAFRHRATPAEMYVQGVSTRKVKTITEEPRGHSFLWVMFVSCR